MTAHQTLLPPGWPRPRGYANGIAASGRLIVTGGLIGWDADEHIVASDLPGQFRQVLLNMLAVLAEGGAGPEHIVRMTWYVVDMVEYRAGLAEIGRHYREIVGRNFPAMAVVEVGALVESAARLEIEVTAVVPG